MYLTVVDKTGRSMTYIDAISESLTLQDVYPWTYDKRQSIEINNSAQHFAKRFKEVPLQYTIKTKRHVSRQQARITFSNLISDQTEQKEAFCKRHLV